MISQAGRDTQRGEMSGFGRRLLLGKTGQKGISGRMPFFSQLNRKEEISPSDLCGTIEVANPQNGKDSLVNLIHIQESTGQTR